MMRARITHVHPNYIEMGVDSHGHVEKRMGTFEAELTLIAADELTFEQALDFMRDKVEFELTPVEE